jgi:hypothetical protein
MNINLINKLSALICGLILLPLAAVAQEVITSSTTVADQSYHDDQFRDLAALRVTGDGVVYDGTNITLTASGSRQIQLVGDYSGNGVVVQYGASLFLTGGSVYTTGSYGTGVSIESGNYATLSGVNIWTNGNGIRSIDSSLTLIDNSIISRKGYALALELSDATVTDTDIQAVGDTHGAVLWNNSTLTLINSSINVSSEEYHVLSASGGDSTVNLSYSTLTGSIKVNDEYDSATLNISGSNGTVIMGDILVGETGNNQSALNITLTGAGTELIGDIVRLNGEGDFSATLTLGDGARVSTGVNGAGSHLTSLTLNDGAILNFTDELQGNYLLFVYGESDGGTISVGENILIDFSGATIEEDGEYYIFGWDESVIGSVNETSFTFTGLGEDLSGNFSVQDGNLIFTATAVPEPTTCFLLGTGLGLLLLTVHYRRRTHS